MAQSAMVRMDRPQETTPDARTTAVQENDARQTTTAASAAAPAGTQVNTTPVANNAEANLQAASAQISRASQAQTPADLRAASQAYNAEAGARDELAKQQQGNGTQTLNVLA
jgi:hypothetical protein